MKIGTFGLDLEPRKYKYTDEYFEALVKKFSPQREIASSIRFTSIMSIPVPRIITILDVQFLPYL